MLFNEFQLILGLRRLFQASVEVKKHEREREQSMNKLLEQATSLQQKQKALQVGVYARKGMLSSVFMPFSCRFHAVFMVFSWCFSS